TIVPAPPETNPPTISLNAANKEIAPGVNPQRIENAIANGIKFLKANQSPTGRWLNGDDPHPVGYAALPALTMLECKVPLDDPATKKAADFVRSNVDELVDTYDISVAILFLDRLGDKSDTPLIHSLTLRLLAGQSSAGGWGYWCPLLTPDESK